jgi:hypothetical protein
MQSDEMKNTIRGALPSGSGSGRVRSEACSTWSAPPHAWREPTARCVRCVRGVCAHRRGWGAVIAGEKLSAEEMGMSIKQHRGPAKYYMWLSGRVWQLTSGALFQNFITVVSPPRHHALTHSRKCARTHHTRR